MLAPDIRSKRFLDETVDDIATAEWLRTLSPQELTKLDQQFQDAPRVAPQPGPQTQAFLSPAEVVGYGGAGGGGKSALHAILALHEHEFSVIFRREKDQLKTMIDDIARFHGNDDGLNRQSGVFRFPDGRVIEFGGLSKPREELKWRGRAHDYIGVDEATEVPFPKIEVVSGWLRSINPRQRCRMMLSFNPPGSLGDDGNLVTEGLWVLEYFAPWLNERHPNPAQFGELRYYYRDSKGDEVETMDPRPRKVVISGDVEMVTPRSRTFIPARVDDNRYFADGRYKNWLAGLPEPFRSKMLKGDFRSGIIDGENQLIPAKWVDAAMDRWKRLGARGRDVPMDAMGVDVSRGGINNTVFARRHANFVDELIRIPKKDTESGARVSALCLEHAADEASICVDVVGVGASTYDFLDNKGANVVAVNGAVRKSIPQPSETKILYNLRAALYWMLRKLLDPANGFDFALPYDNRLRSEIVAIRYVESGALVKIEEKQHIKERLGWSPDEADAVVYSLMTMTSEPQFMRLFENNKRKADLDRLYRKVRLPTRGSWMGR